MNFVRYLGKNYLAVVYHVKTITIIITIPVVLLESIDERLDTDPPTVDVLIIFSNL